MSKYKVAMQATVTAYIEVELADRELLEEGVIDPTSLRARQLAVVKALASDSQPLVHIASFGEGVNKLDYDVSHWYTPVWEDSDDINAELIPMF